MVNVLSLGVPPVCKGYTNVPRVAKSSQNLGAKGFPNLQRVQRDTKGYREFGAFLTMNALHREGGNNNRHQLAGEEV